MPTKYRAQVNMTAKPKLSQVRRDAAVLPPTATDAALSARVRSATLRPIKGYDESSEPHDDIRSACDSVPRGTGPLSEPCKRVFELIKGLSCCCFFCSH